MNNITIQPYDKRYQQQVIDLILGIQVGEFGINVSLDDQPDLLQVKDIYQINNGNFWIALADNKVIGTIALYPVAKHIAMLKKMFVNSAYRGTGLAQKLVEILLQHAKHHEFTDIYLGTVSKLAGAHRFYSKCGFNQIDRQQLPSVCQVMDVDDVFFSYSLKS